MVLVLVSKVVFLPVCIKQVLDTTSWVMVLVLDFQHGRFVPKVKPFVTMANSVIDQSIFL